MLLGLLAPVATTQLIHLRWSIQSVTCTWPWPICLSQRWSIETNTCWGFGRYYISCMPLQQIYAEITTRDVCTRQTKYSITKHQSFGSGVQKVKCLQSTDRQHQSFLTSPAKKKIQKSFGFLFFLMCTDSGTSEFIFPFSFSVSWHRIRVPCPRGYSRHIAHTVRDGMLS